MLLLPHGSPLLGAILGMGRSGVIVRRGDTAIKMPLTYGTATLNNAYYPNTQKKAQSCQSCSSCERNEF
jgi:hypothetical protein